MSDLDLFGGDEAGPRDARAGGDPPGDVDSPDSGAPLATRMRPRNLDEFVGQRHLLTPGRALRELIERDEAGSMILWGPPGTGKTTLARIIARRTRAAFVPFSAVTEGVPRVREIIREAAARRKANGRRTILFCDEIHRFNKAQQDAFLPHVEAGTVSLIGATTENPSFEVIGALLSRSRVVVLEPLSEDDIREILRRALEDAERGLGALRLGIDDDALALLATTADGDARRALNALEVAAELARGDGPAAAEPTGASPDGGAAGRITAAHAREALQHRAPRYDKGGEEHFNLISALHKAVRGSDPDAALYWLARMLEAGEDPLYLARRLVRMAAEDIGLADPQALRIALAARDAFHFLGSPEGDLALAEAAVYLATAPKSNRIYRAFGAAREAARDTPAEPVPLHIRNAPTRLMKDLGYGAGYRYAFDSEDHFLPQDYLPESLAGASFYEPSDFGFERRIAERMAWWRERRRAAPGAEAAPDTGSADSPPDAEPERGS